MRNFAHLISATISGAFWYCAGRYSAADFPFLYLFASLALRWTATQPESTLKS